jgi:folylpolyglutamate synthase/dihydropteroate synthase
LTPADAYIDSLQLFGMQFGLERMHDLLDRLGNPERACAPARTSRRT